MFKADPDPKHLLLTICLGLGLAGVGAPLTAVADPMTFAAMPEYDPVAHALEFGLTPEQLDARFDRGLAAAERCVTGDYGSVSGCNAQTVVLASLPTS